MIGKKGGLFVSMIILLVIYLFACAIVFVFFYFFKFHVITTILDEYRWNKIQEVPLSLLSADLDGESFVYRVNKVHYLGSDAEKNQLKDKINDFLTEQLFHYFPGTEYPFRVIIKVDGIEAITKYLTGCRVVEGSCASETDEFGVSVTMCHCYCSADCGYNKNKCLTYYKVKQGECWSYSVSGCISREAVVYSAKYPFPLTFNGTDKFIDELSYEVEETG